MVSASSVVASPGRSSAYSSNTWPLEAEAPTSASRATRPVTATPRTTSTGPLLASSTFQATGQFPHTRRSSRRPNRLVHGCKNGTLGWHPSICHPERKSSRERPALRRARHRRGGDRRSGRRRPVAPSRLRARPHQRRCATGWRSRCSSVALLLPWNLDFGLGVPVSNGLLFAVVVVVTLLAIACRAGAARRPVPAHRPAARMSAGPAGSGCC